MELRSIGNSLLRSGSRSFLTFLPPPLGRCRFLLASGNAFDSVLLHQNSSQKNAFSTCGSPIYAPAATSAPSPTPEPDSAESDPEELGRSHFVRHMSHHEIDSLIDQTGIARNSTSTLRYSPSQGSPQGQSSQRGGPTTLSTLDIFKAHFDRRASDGSIHDQMIIPGQPHSDDAHNNNRLSSSQTARGFFTRPLRPRAVRTIESSPRVGRTVEVNARKGVDVATALRRLNSECAKNNVRYDRISQRYHERPGLKRKRLQRLRWRARFKEGFRAMVLKVQAMRRKGW